MKGEGGNQPSAKLTALSAAPGTGRIPRILNAALRITAGAGYKLQDFKIYAQGATERKEGEKVQQKSRHGVFFLSFYKQLQ